MTRKGFLGRAAAAIAGLIVAGRARADSSPLCPECGQHDHGQTGEYHCETCGLPRLWDQGGTSFESKTEAIGRAFAEQPLTITTKAWGRPMQLQIVKWSAQPQHAYCVTAQTNNGYELYRLQSPVEQESGEKLIDYLQRLENTLKWCADAVHADAIQVPKKKASLEKVLWRYP